MSDPTFEYPGRELEIFAHAENWKAYWHSRIRGWIRGDVLEVGAGLGVNTKLLRGAENSWLCLEPDAQLGSTLQRNVAALNCEVSFGTIADVADRRFDTILYIDVLEHIESDRDELANAANLLKPGGHVIVLSPAHQYLFSEFDASIGHFRRYNKSLLSGCSPRNCRMDSMFYLDSVGMAASLMNRWVLRQSMPSLAQIKSWDTYIVPVSRLLDPLLGYGVGKTIVGVWTKNQGS
jgi:SAM-dependent methyltransferase